MIWIRLAITAFLVFMIYRETGIWTATAFALLTLTIELIVKVLKEIERSLDLLMRRAIKGDV